MVLLIAGVAVGFGRGTAESPDTRGMPTAADVQLLLDQRVAAVDSGDLGAWLATSAGSSGDALHAAERERFDHVGRLPVTMFGLALRSIRGSPSAAVARITLSYRLGSAPVAEHTDAVDVVWTPDGWRLGDSEPAMAVTAGGTLPPWYLPGVRAMPVDGVGTVLFWPGTAPGADEVARLAAAGARSAFDALGEPPDGVVIAVPDTAAAHEAMVPGTGEAGSGFAAVTTDPGPGRGGDLVVINPQVWPGLDGRERQVILTHELVHVAVGAAIGGGQPLWLAEGYADHVALAPVLASGVTRQQLAVVAPDAAAGGAVPADLPTADDFASGEGQPYTTAWLAVDYLIRSHGEQAAIDLHTRLRAVGASADVQVEDAALQSVLGVTREQFVTAWRTDLAAITASVAAPTIP